MITHGFMKLDIKSGKATHVLYWLQSHQTRSTMKHAIMLILGLDGNSNGVHEVRKG